MLNAPPLRYEEGKIGRKGRKLAPVGWAQGPLVGAAKNAQPGSNRRLGYENEHRLTGRDDVLSLPLVLEIDLAARPEMLGRLSNYAAGGQFVGGTSAITRR